MIRLPVQFLNLARVYIYIYYRNYELLPVKLPLYDDDDDDDYDDGERREK